MPLYELFCMARPALARTDAAQLMRNVAAAVLKKDGILTDIKSFGDHPLAYTIRRPGQRYEEVIALSELVPCGGASIDSSLYGPEQPLTCTRMFKQQLEGTSHLADD